MNNATAITFLNHFLAFALGFLYSFAELLKKFKEASSIFKLRVGWIYLIINGFISLSAFVLLNQIDLKIGNQDVSEPSKILIAGVSALALFRSSILSVKVPGSTSKADFSSVIQIILDWVQSIYDQKRAGLLMNDVKKIMERVDFNKAELILPDLCIELRKTVAENVQKQLGSKVEKIKKSTKLNNNSIDINFAKSLHLGIVIAEHAGIIVLEEAVSQLGQAILLD